MNKKIICVWIGTLRNCHKTQNFTRNFRPIMSIQFYLFSCLLLFSCEKENVDPKLIYNQKANEVMQQFILDESCECIKEIPKESMVKISLIENAARDIRKQLVERLHLKNTRELDSLERFTDNFTIDSAFIKQNKITIVPKDSLRELGKDPKFCENGILCIRKPVFDKEYENAVIDYGYAFMCLSSPWVIYKFKEGKWQRQKNY